jgi:hypothetical protein
MTTMGSDGAPTQGVRAMYDEHTQELQRLETEFGGLVTGDLAKLNEMAENLGIRNIIVPGKPENSKRP